MVDRIVPEAPKSFSKDIAEIWDKVWENNPNIDPNRDFLAVKTLCQVLNEMSIIESLLAGPKTKALSKRIHENSNGTVQIYPLVVQARELRNELRLWLKALGLTLEDASKLDLPDPAREAKRKDIVQAPDRRIIVEGKRA